MSRLLRITAALVGIAGAVGIGPVDGAGAAGTTPTPIPPSADWLTTVNYYRAMAGVAPVVENTGYSADAALHSRWIVKNGLLSHDEPNGSAYWTPGGDLAGNNGNVAASSVYGTTARQHIELWMSGPFHALGIIRPNAREMGFGVYDEASASPWRSAATLDILRGLDMSAGGTATPIVFPGNGTTTNLTTFHIESPNPLAFCGNWTAPAGQPVVAIMPEPTPSATVSITGPNGPIDTCTLTTSNTNGVAQQILAADNAVVGMPRSPLPAGSYTITITAPARTVSWSFVVDPSVAAGPPSPLPSTSATGPTSKFLPLRPDRLVDSRRGIGAGPLRSGLVTKVRVGGRSGVPVGAIAVSANFTVVEPNRAGFITAYPCGRPVPDASTVNFQAGGAYPNQATVPLDANGDLCVSSSADAHLLIDVNGALTTSGPARYTPLAPDRILDTRSGVGGAFRQQAGATLTLQVTGRGGVPAGASAVSLNVTAVQPAGTGYVTVYPCGGALPDVSNLNTSAGVDRPNLVVVPLSASGTVCLYTAEAGTDLLADVAGYYSTSGSAAFTSLEPLRMLDTRQVRDDISFGSGAARIAGGSTVRVPLAGMRGVPGDARAVSVNITVTSTLGDGYLTAYPCGSLPNVSNINFRTGNDVANAAQLTLDATGAVCVWASATTHILLDINGVWA